MGDTSEDLCAIQRSQGVDSDGKRANQQVVLPSMALEDDGGGRRGKQLFWRPVSLEAFVSQGFMRSRSVPSGSGPLPG